MIYPDGAKVDYTYNADAQISTVSLNGKVLMSGITYQPFGPVSGWTWGDGTASTRSYDLDGRLVAQTLAGDNRSLSYDADGDITNISDSQASRDYDYDALRRLTAANDASLSWSYAYDANGNRTSLTDASGVTAYRYAVGNNHLASLSGTTARSYQYDADGNTIADGQHTYQYDARNRLVGVDGSVHYQLNSLGQRVAKQTAKGTTTLYLYDPAGHLIAEASGAIMKDYIYVNGAPVAVLLGNDASGKVYRFTPRQGSQGVALLVDTVHHRLTVSGLPGISGTYTVPERGWHQERRELEVHLRQGHTLSIEGEFQITHKPYRAELEIHRRPRHAEYRLTGQAKGDVFTGVNWRTGAEITLRVDRAQQTVVVEEAGQPARTLPVIVREDSEHDRHRHHRHHHREHEHDIHFSITGHAENYRLRAEVEVEHGKVHGEVDISDGPRLHVEYRMTGKKASGLYYVHTDQLGTPRVVSDSLTGTVVWRWDGESFGATAANEDPDGDGIKFTFNLRFPGQYYDSETGLYYNYFRYYDPRIGRYITADPIGLNGGINLYAYVSGNPLNYIDPYGFAPSWAGPTGAVVATTGGTVAGIGIRIGNPYVIGAGAGMFVVGNGLMLWDTITSPVEAIRGAKDRLKPLKDSIDELNRENNRSNSNDKKCE